MAESPKPRRIPLIFYRSLAGEPVREWLKGLPETEGACDWEGFVAGAMAVASRDAIVPPAGRWVVGDPNGSADEADGASAPLSLP
jgi:hypothetical protein